MPVPKAEETNFSMSRKMSSPARGSSSTSLTYTLSHFWVAPLVFLCPFFVMVFGYTIVKLDGSLSILLQEIRQKGAVGILYSAWTPYIFGSAKAWKMLLPFVIFQLALMKILPGKLTKGPVTPTGNVPLYKGNGMLAYFTSLITFLICAYLLKVFNPAEIYDHYLEIIGAMNILSLMICLGLYFKGIMHPSSSDHGVSGSFLFDYYWGTELYPRILDWDVKMFTICRFGMMGWPLLILSYAAKQYEAHGLSDSMVVAVSLQLIYITKFFHWEMGYMKTLDIIHDQAGFYLVSIHTSRTSTESVCHVDLPFLLLCGCPSLLHADLYLLTCTLCLLETMTTSSDVIGCKRLNFPATLQGPRGGGNSTKYG